MFTIKSFYGNTTNVIARDITDLHHAIRLARQNAHMRYKGFHYQGTLPDMWGHDAILNYGNGSHASKIFAATAQKNISRSFKEINQMEWKRDQMRASRSVEDRNDNARDSAILYSAASSCSS